MAIRDLSRPLPECSNPECGAPMSRAAHADQMGKCSDCQTPADRMACEHRRQHLARLRHEGSRSTGRRVDDRIARLATKRQADAARAAGLLP